MRRPGLERETISKTGLCAKDRQKFCHRTKKRRVVKRERERERESVCVSVSRREERTESDSLLSPS